MLGAGRGPNRAQRGGVNRHGRILDRLYLAAAHHCRAERALARPAPHHHRLCALCRPQDLGGGADQARPQRGRPLGPAAIVRRSAQIHRQGTDHTGWRQQGRVPAGSPGHRRACALRLGGHSGQRRMGYRRPQYRNSLHFRDLLADGLRRHHGGVVIELQISIPRVAAFGGADGFLRSFHRLRHHYRPARVRSICPRSSTRRTATGACSIGTGCRCSRCS